MPWLLPAIFAAVHFCVSSSGLPLAASPKTWTELTRTDGIFPAEIDAVFLSEDASSAAAMDEESVAKELETLLSDPQVLQTVYRLYLVKFGKPLTRAYERDASGKIGFRAELLKTVLLQVARHNVKFARGETSWTQKVTLFCDMTEDEFASGFLGGGPPPSSDLMENQTDIQDFLSSLSHVQAPAAKDWRAEGKVNPIRAQKQGDCWAFASISVAESRYAINSGQLVDLAVQELDDICLPAGHGGFAYRGIQWIIDNGGVSLEKNYPYRGELNGPCLAKGEKIKAVNSMKRLHVVPDGENALINAIAEYGPVAVSCHAKDWNRFGGGVIDERTDCKKADGTSNHAVSVVGYDADRIIVRNSWGTGAGDKGYYYFKRGINACGINNDIVVATS